MKTLVITFLIIMVVLNPASIALILGSIQDWYDKRHKKEQAMDEFEEIANYMKRVVEQMDASRNQEIKGYIFRAVADIARKCGVDQSEVWAEMEYWSRSKG